MITQNGTIIIRPDGTLEFQGFRFEPVDGEEYNAHYVQMLEYGARQLILELFRIQEPIAE